MGGFVNTVPRIGSEFKPPDEGCDAANLFPLAAGFVEAGEEFMRFLWSHVALSRLLLAELVPESKPALFSTSFEGPDLAFWGVQPPEPPNLEFPEIQLAEPTVGGNAPCAPLPHELLGG